MPIIWRLPDGRLEIERIAPKVLDHEQRLHPEETVAQTVERIALTMIRPKRAYLAGLTPVLVVEASLPATRVRRNQWRLNRANEIVVDPTVPDTPPPARG